MHTNKIKTNPIDRAVQVLIYIIVIALCLVILLPCINVVALAFNDGADAARGGIWFWPREFTLDNFKEVFKDGSITTAYGITIARTVIGTFLSLMVTTLAGYALKQQDLPGRTIITMLILTAGQLLTIGFEKWYLMKNSMNLGVSEVISTYTYKRGLVDGDFSYASAVEMMQSVVNFVILISVNKFSKRFSDTSLW